MRGEIAGKTGTTNKQRDSWFAGYTPERATVVWVGYDDNSRTRLSGARAALPIWIRFMAKVAPPNGYSYFKEPPGVTTALIDPATGRLATGACPETITEVFRQGEVPTEVCNHHGGWAGPQVVEVEGGTITVLEETVATAAEVAAEAAVEERSAEEDDRREKRRPLRRWLKKVFGEKDRERGSEDRSGPPPP